MVLLGKEVGNFCGIGMHGGVMYIRGDVPAFKLGREVKIVPMTKADDEILNNILREYAADFTLDPKEIFSKKFIKLVPGSTRPYGRLYAY